MSLKNVILVLIFSRSSSYAQVPRGCAKIVSSSISRILAKFFFSCELEKSIYSELTTSSSFPRKHLSRIITLLAACFDLSSFIAASIIFFAVVKSSQSLFLFTGMPSNHRSNSFPLQRNTQTIL